MIGLVLIILYVGMYLGSVSSITWLICVILSILLDVFLLTPFRVLLIYFTIAGAIMQHVRAFHGYMVASASRILQKPVDLAARGVDIVQHFNPACRAARQCTSSSFSKFLLAVDDLDVPSNPNVAVNHSISLMSSIVVSLTSALLCCVSAYYVDVVVDFFVSLFIPCLILCFY